MKVILNQTVPKVGKEGQVVTVKDGYARNYLFPRSLATLADKNQLKALNIKNARIATKLAETKSAAEALKEKLEGKTVSIEAKVGKELGKLYGAITNQDVADAIKSQLKVDLEKKQVGLLEPIKRLGTYKLSIDLHREVDAHIDLNVFDPNAPVDEPKAEATPEPEAEAAEPEAVTA